MVAEIIEVDKIMNFVILAKLFIKGEVKTVSDDSVIKRLGDQLPVLQQDNAITQHHNHMTTQ